MLVTRLWYLREVDPRTILYTGLTRDGTFLIENGKISKAVKNFRFNDSPLFMLNNLDAMGRPVRLAGTEQGGAVVVPAVRCTRSHERMRTDLFAPVRRCRKAERPFGTLRLLGSGRTSFGARSEKVLYSIGGTTILSLPIVTIRKSSRRFCCQQASLCSLQAGRSSP